MNATHERTARDLNHTISTFGARPDVVATEDGVIVPEVTARKVVASLGFLQGGARMPFVNALLSRPNGDVLLRGDEGMHLRRALDDIAREVDRRKRIDRGQIPGTLSAAEALRLARKHPQLFGGGARRS